jgi:hypothetical protein
MNVAKTIDSVIQYISEAMTRIFIAKDDTYPAIGVQPFSGEPFSEWLDL